jgi:hypothetical protein
MNNEREHEATNRPFYESIEINKHSSYQLFIGELASDTLNELYETCIHYDKKQLCIAATSPDIDSDLTFFLSTAPVNTTVYIQGSEAFIWKLWQRVKVLGLVDEQIKMFQPENKQRDLFCVHCFTTTHEVTQTPALCDDCQRLLVVTEHFSKHHAAYMGYQVNAENPTEIPDPKEFT